ncbi:MAG: hypothetical protein JWN64_406 [Parcubacteria group bacterium]|nr:hypothetical protein [Parcubacteria group bacterium]
MAKQVSRYLVLAVAVVLCLLAFAHHKAQAPQTQPVSNSAAEEYVRAHISELSPEPAVLGGTLFVTQITTNEGVGVVSYEDGHNAFTADFSYTKGTAGQVTVTSFVVRKLK